MFHIGLALVFLGYAPHIAFVRRLTGVGWPALPDAVMYLAAGVTIVSLLLALVVAPDRPGAQDDLERRRLDQLDRRLPAHLHRHGGDERALRRRSWRATMCSTAAPLAVHLLTLELLLIWFPFGKLMHAVLFAFSRGATGMRFSHRGVTV